jgi:hypothetical protein
MRTLAYFALAQVCAVVATLVRTPLARAQEAAPRLMSEPSEYTSVVDAFDGDDPFDLDVHVGFSRSVELASINREIGGDAGVSGTPQALHVADSERIVNLLLLGVDVGVYRDLMAYTRLPLVLSDTRTLSLPSASQCGDAPCADVDAVLREDVRGASRRLFEPAFAARTRSGVPALDFGVAWGVTNQYRSPAMPTWVISAETRVSVGDVMRPCAASGAVCDGGISRGTARVRLESRWSYRFRHVEPFLGVAYAHEWATSGEDVFTPAGALPGFAEATPPELTEGTFGVSIMAWEARGRSQRLAIDLTSRASYVSAGRDFTPLFDALGTSSSPHLTTENDERITGGVASRAVPFTGLTNSEAYARLRLETALVMQAAQYVRFRLGFGVGFASAHLITDAPRCNESARATSSSDPRAGVCEPNLWNPLHRAVIDSPGQRFQVSDDLAYDLFARAVGQF